MEILSVIYASSVIASVFIYYLLNYKYRVVYLVFLSGCFIASYHFSLLIYILLYTFINFYLGIKIPGAKYKNALFRVAIVINLTQIILLKYSSFLIDPLLKTINLDLPVGNLAQLIMPFGISYFTLQGIGYQINIKMGWEKPERKFMDFLLYIIFFPKFLSGPIERSNHFLPQIKGLRSFNYHQVTEGLRIALIGFFQKVVIANQLATVVNTAYADLGLYGSLDLWIVLMIQPLYLYFDFSGYTNIAIGFAKTYGIDLLPNFNKPFLSENVSTFWKRFHMSLSLWFNDYVFKQVSFKYRKWGKYASVFAVFLTFCLFGIWHGAGWNFMALGLLQAVAINYEFFSKGIRTRIGNKIHSSINKLVSRLITYTFFGLSLVLFFSPNLQTSFQYFATLIDITSWSKLNPLYNLAIFSLGGALVFMILEYLKQDHESLSKRVVCMFHNSTILRVIIYWILTMCVLVFIGQKLNFIYQVF